MFVCPPGRSEYIHAFQALRTVHLREHLVYNPICDPRAVVAPAKTLASSLNLSQINKPFRCYGVELIEEQDARLCGSGPLEQISNLSDSQG